MASSIEISFGLDQQDVLIQLYTDARKAQADGDYKTATQKYECLIKLRPEMAEAHANLGVLYYQQGQAEQALQTFSKAIQLKPDLAGPHFFLGVLSFNNRNYEEASKYLKRAETLDPSNFAIQLYSGYNHYARSSYLEATRHFEKAVAMEGTDPDAFYHLSKSYGHLSKQFFDQLHKTYRDSIYTHLARAHFYEADQNWEGAKEDYRLATEKRPNNQRLKQRLQWVTDRASGEAASSLESVPADDMVDGSLKFLYAPPTGGKIKEELQRYQNQVQVFTNQKEDSAEKLYGLAESYQILSYLASLWIAETDPDSYREPSLAKGAIGGSAV
jgi:tetratricopeptide (TPR) repeat protein